MLLSTQLGSEDLCTLQVLTLSDYCCCRGTDFSDTGDVLVDADCQHTEDKGKWLGSKRSIHLHTGFYRAWESVAPSVIPLVWAQLQQVRPDARWIRAASSSVSHSGL